MIQFLRYAPPLSDTVGLRWRGSLPARIAAHHLGLLGARDEPHPGPRTAPGRQRSDGPRRAAGHLVVKAGGGTGEVGCDIEWSGPLGLDVRDEATVQAACGLMQVHGRRWGRPEPLGVDAASVAAGVVAVQGVLAALLARLRGLDIRAVQTSVAHVALLALGQYLASATAPGGDGTGPPRTGGPPFVAADGVRFEIEALEAGAWRGFWTGLDAEPSAIAQGWEPFMRRYTSATCPLPRPLHDATARQSFARCVQAAQAAGVSILRVHGGETGGLREPRPWRLEPLATPGAAAGLAPAGAAAGRPLAGLVVVEACRRVLGPLATHVLRLLGARVVRIEPPGGDLLRGMPPLAGDCSARFLALNRGKDVVRLDLRSPHGRTAVLDLVADADVFVHNLAPGKAAQLGLDSGDLAAVRPELVYVRASGWGGHLGPQPPAGTEFMVQAASGLADLLRPGDEPPTPSLMTVVDTLGGLVAAEGALAGLLARQLSGHGQRVDASLLAAATILVDAHRGAAPPGARLARHPLLRPLATADGHVALARRSFRQPRRLAAALDLPSASGRLDDGAVRDHVRRRPTRVWLERLRAAGLHGAPVCTDLAVLAADPRLEPALERADCTFVRAPWRFS